jgi:hypothetical protein
MRPLRRKPYQEYHTFVLRISFELDVDGLVSLKLEHLSWSCLLGEVFQIAPPYFTMGGTLFKHIFTYPWSQYRLQASSICSLLDSNLNLRFDLINPRINSSFSIMMMSWRCTWELTQSYSSRHTWYRLNSIMTNLRITPWITPWSSHNLLYFYLITTLEPTYGSSIVYGQILQT